MTSENKTLEKYLSPLSVWALSFGCAVGWGSFVMPGTTFLPQAGLLGTVIGLIIGAVIMFIIGVNYNYLMNKYPNAGGTLTYSTRLFGYDHGFLCSWFLILVYIAIIWANASALGLISKNLLGSTFQFGFHYQVLEYDVYFGEVLLSIATIVLCGIIGILGKKLTAFIQVIFAFLLIGGIVVVAFKSFLSPDTDLMNSIVPSFATADQDIFASIKQVSTIVALSPWAYVGFESVSNSAAGFKFDSKKTIWILTISLLTGVIAYVSLALLAVMYLPEGYGNWTNYIKELGKIGGLAGIPTFYGAYRTMGNVGVMILGIAAFAGIMTGLIGNMVAASRLMYSMADEGILPKWFGILNKDKSPQNALMFLVGISLIIPFFGRTAIGWIVDVNTVGATIAYAYTSACAYKKAKEESNTPVMATGGIGFVCSLIFFIYFMSWSAGAMATESYLILASWCIIGFIYFRFVFEMDNEKRFGKSVVVWITLLFLIFFTSLMWFKESTDEVTEYIARNISEYYDNHNVIEDSAVLAESEAYLENQLEYADAIITRNSFIQMILIIASLAIMFSIYSLMTKRQRIAEAEKISAIERSKAKTVFLSNMSHDIRTPMNAIIGYINLAERDDITLSELKEYLEKIKGSSHHLLALINDILEMSRIESGKMELEPIAMNLFDTINEVKDLFQTQMDEKKVEYVVDASELKDGCVYCDKNRLNRVLLNLISNAYKFTPEGGSVYVKAAQLSCDEEGYGKYEIRVKDSGIGMSEEFAAKVFEAFEREKTAIVTGIQGTGLGMAITKSIVDLMGGDIKLKTAVGKGTEFIVTLKLKLQEKTENISESPCEQATKEPKKEIDFSKVRILLVDDMKINREIASKLLERMGFKVEQSENGQQAMTLVEASDPGYFDLVLMDIQMPVMDGYDAARSIRALEDKQKAEIPIIAMTANAFSEDVKKAQDAGMNGHIAKPIDVNQMIATITEVIN